MKATPQVPATPWFGTISASRRSDWGACCTRCCPTSRKAPALGILDRLDLDGYYLLHATRGEMLARLGRRAEAAAAFARALELTRNETEREFLRRRATQLSS